MFSLNETNQFMVYSNSVDLRKGVDPLCGIAHFSGQKPTDGSVYVFFNRSRTLMKLLHSGRYTAAAARSCIPRIPTSCAWTSAMSRCCP
jgi:hypothetical protein